MRFLSVCSGIEAASTAWQPLGWKAVAFSEIEPFPCAVLAHHYPDTPNWGDMTKYKDWPDVSIDLLCGGTPCQSFSVAGLRKGLDDPRGNLMLTFGAIAAKYRPKWLVWENVPGVLSSNGGRDFGSFLGLLGELGYGFAYRVLDAQYVRVESHPRAVPQRRRRVFVVGHIGDWHRAAAVLFERESLCRHPAPRRQAGEGLAASVTPSLTASGRGVERSGDTRGQDPVIAVPAVAPTAYGGNNTSGAINVATVRSASASASGRLDFGSETFLVTHSLRDGGLIPAVAPMIVLPIHDTATRHAGTDGSGNQNGKAHGFGIGKATDPMFTLTKGDKHAIAYSTKLHNTKSNQAGKIYEGYTVGLDRNSPPPAVMYEPAIAVSLRGREGGGTAELGDEVQNCMRASGGGGDKPHVLTAMQVRRLTPLETERLMGFPDGYTAITVRGKPAADGPRYKSHGNSWAVNVAAWVGKRIQEVDAIESIATNATNYEGSNMITSPHTPSIRAPWNPGIIAAHQDAPDDHATAIVIKVRSAFERLRSGTGNADDFNRLGAAMNVALIRAEAIDPLAEQTMVAGMEAMAECGRIWERHHRYGFTGPGLIAVTDAVELYEGILRLSKPIVMERAAQEAARRMLAQAREAMA